MCGICGIYSFGKQKVEKSKLKMMNDQMISRGPDSEGFFMNDNFGMAMRRLSVIDIDKSNQPIVSENNNIAIIFNGEIYNFIEIKNKFLKNVKFKTNGDTEVILRLYENFGEKFISKLIGMFSICIYDKNKKKILIYRDRFGIKPLYYHYANNSLYFSSSLHSFRKILRLKKSKESFLLYLCFNYFPSDTSAYEDVFSLLPGEYIKIENNSSSVQRYGKFFADEKTSYFQNSSKSSFKEILNNSISINLRSDVKLGLMLSSGLDSSILAKEITKNTKDIKAYTVDFENKHENESKLAKKFARELGLNHETLEIKKDDVPQYLNEILKYMDEPCADTAIIPSYLISKKAKRDGIKVLLSGAGGDEIFAGYGRHYLNFFTFFYGIFNFLKLKNHKLIQIFPYKIQNILLKSFNKKFAYIGNSSGQNLGVIFEVLDQNSQNKLIDLLEKILFGLIKSNFGFDSQSIINTDLSLYLPDNILRPFDKVSMINSIEGRVPFLDHRFLEIIQQFNLDVTNKGSLKNNKTILRDLYKDELPSYILNNTKKGFNAPLKKWNLHLNKNLSKEYFEDILNMNLIYKNDKNENYKSFLYNLNTYRIWAEYN